LFKNDHKATPHPEILMSSPPPALPAVRRKGRQALQDKDELASATLRQFRLVFNAVKTHFQQLERSAGVGGSQVWALSIVRQQAGIGTSGLAVAMDIHQSTASNLVRGLVDRGLIEAYRSESDGRAVALHITTEGKRLLSQVPGPFTGVLPAALTQLDEKALRRLNKDLAALLKLLGPVDKKAAKTPLADI
jgi:DNA-binding MarR family transcriptional regulator